MGIIRKNSRYKAFIWSRVLRALSFGMSDPSIHCFAAVRNVVRQLSLQSPYRRSKRQEEQTSLAATLMSLSEHVKSESRTATQSHMDTRGRPHARLLCRRYGSKVINTIVMIHRQVRHVRTLARRSFSLRSELRCTGSRPLFHDAYTTYAATAACFADVLSTVLRDNNVFRS